MRNEMTNPAQNHVKKLQIALDPNLSPMQRYQQQRQMFMDETTYQRMVDEIADEVFKRIVIYLKTDKAKEVVDALMKEINKLVK